MYERLVYVSRAVPGTTSRQAYDIIRVSHNRNSEYGLTGGLLLLDGYFIQVIEGDGFRVRERFAAICADTRHTDVDLRQSIVCEAALFPGEWMALRSDAEIPASLKERFSYVPGLPAAQFSPNRITAFVQACCSASQQTDCNSPA
jgi:hypothetical protein